LPLPPLPRKEPPPVAAAPIGKYPVGKYPVGKNPVGKYPQANRVLQDRIGYLLRRPVGRPPNEVRRFHANFIYRAGSWTKPRRVIAKVEWHPGELYPRVGFIVTNLSRPAERVVVCVPKIDSARREAETR